MKKNGLLLVAASIVATGLFVPAAMAQTSAQQVPTNTLNVQNTAPISWSQLTKQLEDKGYIIREIERKNDGFKANVTDRDYNRYELRLNLQGEVVQQRTHDN